MNSMRSTRQWLQRLWRGHPVLMVLLAYGPAVVLGAMAPLRKRLSGMLATGLPMTGGAARAAPPWSSSLPCCRVGDRALHAGDVGAQGLGLRFEGARRVDTRPRARSKPARLVSYAAHQRLGVGDLRVYRRPPSPRGEIASHHACPCTTDVAQGVPLCLVVAEGGGAGRTAHEPARTVALGAGAVTPPALGGSACSAGGGGAVAGPRGLVRAPRPRRARGALAAPATRRDSSRGSA